MSFPDANGGFGGHQDPVGLAAPCDRGAACSSAMQGRGGVDQHHPWPTSWGGSANQPLRLLCPNHHRRQHSLLAAWQQHQGPPPYAIRRRFTKAENADAAFAFTSWVAAGRPPIGGEPAPPATGG